MAYRQRYFTDGQVTTPQITESAITSDKIADETIESRDIKNAAIQTEDIADKAVTLAKLGDDVPAVGIPDNSISAAKLADDSVEKRHIKTAAVDTDELAVASVTTEKLRDGNVTNAKLATNSVTQSKIAANAVGASEIQANAVGTSELANNAVSTDKIQDASVTQAKLDPAIVLGGDRFVFGTLGTPGMQSADVFYLTDIAADIPYTVLDLSPWIPANAKGVILQLGMFNQAFTSGRAFFRVRTNVDQRDALGVGIVPGQSSMVANSGIVPLVVGTGPRTIEYALESVGGSMECDVYPLYNRSRLYRIVWCTRCASATG